MLNKVILLVIFNFALLIYPIDIQAQTDSLDIAILKSKFQNSGLNQHKISFENKANGLVSRFLNSALKIYKMNISQQISAECLYEISCSTFSQMALKQFGILKGVALTADRLARCNRISATTISEFRINENGKVIDSPDLYKIKND